MKSRILKHGDGFEVKFTVQQYGYPFQHFKLTNNPILVLSLLWPFRVWVTVTSFNNQWSAEIYKEKLDAPEIKEVVTDLLRNGECGKDCNCEMHSPCKRMNTSIHTVVYKSKKGLFAFPLGRKPEFEEDGI